MCLLTRSWRIATAALVAALGLTVVGAATVGAKSAGKSDSATAWVAVTHTLGSTLYLAGNTTDKVLGKGAVAYTIKTGTGTKPGTIKTTGTITEFTTTGSLSGSVQGTLTTTSSGSVTQSGKIDLSHGTGGQKGHSYVGTYSGTGASATGPFVFHTKATYQ